MTEFFEMFIIYISDFWTILGEYGFEFYGVTISLPYVLFAFLLISLACSFFWKGART